jgi:hypothetical protein
LEKEVMFWLTIDREPVSFSELKEDLLSPHSKEQLSSTLQSLQREILLEKSIERFTLQPVLALVHEYNSCHSLVSMRMCPQKRKFAYSSNEEGAHGHETTGDIRTTQEDNV